MSNNISVDLLNKIISISCNLKDHLLCNDLSKETSNECNLNLNKCLTILRNTQNDMMDQVKENKNQEKNKILPKVKIKYRKIAQKSPRNDSSKNFD